MHRKVHIQNPLQDADAHKGRYMDKNTCRCIQIPTHTKVHIQFQTSMHSVKLIYGEIISMKSLPELIAVTYPFVTFGMVLCVGNDGNVTEMTSWPMPAFIYIETDIIISSTKRYM